MFSMRDPAALAEGHLPVAVERAAGIDADGQRGDLGVLAPAAGEEVADRALDRRAAPGRPSRCAGCVNRQCAGRASSRSAGWRPGPRCRPASKVSPGRDADAGRDLPALAEVAGRALAGPSVAMPALPFSPVKFSGLIERVCAFDSRDRLPRPMPSPLKLLSLSLCGAAAAAKTANISTASPALIRIALFMPALLWISGPFYSG